MSEPLEESRRAVMEWFSVEGRDLPWRSTRDPWAILVSELMLQQTQVARVVDRLPQFLSRFASPAACASAPAGEVIDEWKGLGYNRRAVNLHRAATMIVAEYGGAIPSELESLLALPGVGPYTARAVLVFSFEHDEAVVDTNIARVLARWGDEALTATAAQRLGDSLVPEGLGWVWNQALMEVGALRCRPVPLCAACPLQTACAWFMRGCAEPDPSHRTAGVSSRQSRFAGSDRQGRGRLVDALRVGSVASDELAQVMGWPEDPARAERVASTLVRDGLAIRCKGEWRLP